MSSCSSAWTCGLTSRSRNRPTLSRIRASCSASRVVITIHHEDTKGTKSFGPRAFRLPECGPEAPDPYKLFVFFVSSWCYEVDFVRHREDSMVAIAREVAPGR